MKLRLATRGSALATTQSGWVADRLRAHGAEVELVLVKTRGDAVTDRPLAEVGGKGLFTKEIEDALLEGRADVAVHSYKDLPSESPSGLIVGAVPLREDPRDVVIGKALADLPASPRIGTGSLRRRWQILALRPDAQLEDLRGNVDTRIGKVRSSALDAIVLAAAGVARLGRNADVAQFLDVNQMVPAPGQGALAVQCRQDATAVVELLRRIHDERSGREVAAERAFLQAIGGGCSVPAGCIARVDAEGIEVTGWFATSPIDQRRAVLRGKDPQSVGCAVAEAVRPTLRGSTP